MKRAWRTAGSIAGVLIMAACSGSRPIQLTVPGNGRPEGTEGQAHESGVLPRLTTNVVLRIAYETARTNGVSLKGYVCEAVRFCGRSTSLYFNDKWLVNFQRVPPAPDYDVVITVNDSTAASELHMR